ncbi:hypothetical protein CGRA01v4_02835 [Colletotrichum graminicola]|nr:hypothetical protein CGRA01v4_02835 [Colletotrichum graminicola]
MHNNLPLPFLLYLLTLSSPLVTSRGSAMSCPNGRPHSLAIASVAAGSHAARACRFGLFGLCGVLLHRVQCYPPRFFGCADTPAGEEKKKIEENPCQREHGTLARAVSSVLLCRICRHDFSHGDR